jgi:hypothetical protein
MANPQSHSGVFPPRLERPVGIINTQSTHYYDRQLQDHTSRLVQRAALPQASQARFEAGILQPTAMVQQFQIQRVEAATGSESAEPEFRLQRSPILEPESLVTAEYQPDEHLAQRPSLHLGPLGHGDQVPEAEPLRPQNTQNHLPGSTISSQSPMIQRTKAATSTQESLAARTPEVFRIQRRAMPLELARPSLSDSLPMAIPNLEDSNSHNPGSTTISSSPSPGLETLTSPIVTPVKAHKAQSLPLAIQRQPIRSEDPASEANPLTHPNLSSQGAEPSAATVVRLSPGNHSQSAPMRLQRQRLAQPSENQSTKVSSLSPSISQNSQNSNIPLTLASSSVVSNRVLNRKPTLQIEDQEASENFIGGRTASSSFPEATSEPGVTPSLDVRQVSEQVYQRIVRRLSLESERRGANR